MTDFLNQRQLNRDSNAMKEDAKLMIHKNETSERSLSLFHKRVLNYYTSFFFLCKPVLQAPTKPIESSTKHPHTKW